MLMALVAVGLALALSACGGTAAPAADPAVTTAAAPPASAAVVPSPAPSLSPVPPAVLATSAAPSISVPSLSIPPLPTFTARGPVVGGDASWPQCPKGMGIAQKRSQGAPMPLASARFVILGLTNGPGFVANPCLGSQLAWARERHLLVSAYSVISGPYGDALQRYGSTGPYDERTAAGRLANLGYQEALFNIATLRGAGLQTPFVWLDVEPVTGFEWSQDTAANAAVVKGAARGYTDQGYGVGVYSIGSLWQRVVGDLRLGLPEWRPAGSRGRAEALRRCQGDWMFQGGAAALAQWVEQGRDRDITCPGQSAYLSLWFHQY